MQKVNAKLTPLGCYAGAGDDRAWGELGNDCKRWRTHAANDETNVWRVAA